MGYLSVVYEDECPSYATVTYAIVSKEALSLEWGMGNGSPPDLSAFRTLRDLGTSATGSPYPGGMSSIRCGACRVADAGARRGAGSVS
ncbi:hypothetical protein GCM10010149_31490 [Nonomuraea roseoviolacea subsp. roseoviolacea]